MNQAVTTTDAPAAIGPYSQGVVARSTLYVSGQIPLDPATGEMPNAAADQARQCLANVFAIVDAAGFQPSDIAQVILLLTDMADFAAVNEIYATSFSEPYPARMAYQVSALPKGAAVEIAAVAQR